MGESQSLEKHKQQTLGIELLYNRNPYLQIQCGVVLEIMSEKMSKKAQFIPFCKIQRNNRKKY